MYMSAAQSLRRADVCMSLCLLRKQSVVFLSSLCARGFSVISGFAYVYVTPQILKVLLTTPFFFQGFFKDCGFRREQQHASNNISLLAQFTAENAEGNLTMTVNTCLQSSFLTNTEFENK